MKKCLLLIVLTIIVHYSFGQTWEEWTQQKETQIKYLIQQIGAQKVYLDYIRKGYGIAQKGLNTIRDIKKGDFNLHSDYFNSLKQVNPKIKNTAKVADIIDLQIRIIKESKKTMQRVKAANQFTDEEITYLDKVFDNLLEECLKNIDELISVITSGELEMKDDERIKRIDRLFDDMQDKFSFCKSFSGQASILAIQRQGEQYEINRSKKLNGVE